MAICQIKDTTLTEILVPKHTRKNKNPRQIHLPGVKDSYQEKLKLRLSKFNFYCIHSFSSVFYVKSDSVTFADFVN